MLAGAGIGTCAATFHAAPARQSQGSVEALGLVALSDYGTSVSASSGNAIRTLTLDASTRADDVSTGNINVSFSFPKDSVKIGKFDLISEDGISSVQVGPTSSGGTVEVPVGKYVGVVIYYTYIKGTTGKYNNLAGVTYVVKEDIDVTAGGSVAVAFNLADANNEYKVRNILPDGQEAVLSDFKYISKKEYEVVKEGNALFIGAYSYLFHKKYGQLEWISVASKGNVVENEFRNTSDIKDFLVYRVNDLSDNFIIGVESVVNTGTDTKNKKDFFIEHFELPSAVKTKGEFRNDVGDYSLFKLPVVQTEPGRLSQYQSTLGDYSVTLDKYLDGKHVGGMSMIAKDIQLCEPKAAKKIPGFQTVVGYSFTDMVYKTETAGTAYYEYSYPTDMNKMYDDSNDRRVYMQPTWDYAYAVQAPASLEAFTHPVVRCNPADISAPLGSSPVYISMLNTLEPDEYADNDDKLALSVQPSHMGYASENISTYYYLNKFSGKFNGEEVKIGKNPWEERDNETIDEWIAYDWSSKGKLKGKCEFTFETSPFSIDGQACSTKAWVSFDSSKEDFVCPAVQYMQFRNSDNKVTHMLDSEAKGSAMYLVAGDFVKKADGVYAPANTLKRMKVQYKHHDAAEYGDMELESLGSHSDMPYFAPAYKADLDKVTATGKKGWFDVCIELEDESGNSIRQAIEPAFFLGELSGIDCVGPDMNGFAVRVIGNEVEVLGAEGAAEIRVYSALGECLGFARGNRLSLDGMTKGIAIIDVSADGIHKSIKTIVK